MMAESPIKPTPYDTEAKVQSFHWWFAVRRKLLKLFLSFLDLPFGCVAVDIGCGVGSNLKILGSAGLNVIGLDRSFRALSLAQKKIKFPLLNGDLNKLPIRPKSVGLIVAMDILEHLDNDIGSIRSFYQALKEEGILILTVPAFRSLWGIQDEVTGHKRRYSRQEIVNKLRQEGFEIMKSSYFNFFLFFPIFLARRLIRLFGLRIESENEINSPIINFFLKVIFSLESYILRCFSFPFGVSIFCIAKK
jgi:SAM-dependent methyltransferase